MKRYYSMTQTGNSASINIYGDITSYPWNEGDVSANNLSRQLEQLNGVSEISVYINSYGGEVAEGLAIYNALKRHAARVKTYVDGFACSIASVIFMAGDERIMNDASLMMIHNAWSIVQGNAAELRKQADDLEKINQASVTAYMGHSTLTEDEIRNLMDNESWILPDEAVEYGFATSIEKSDSGKVSQSAKRSLFEIIQKHLEAAEDETEEEEEETTDTEQEDTEEEPTGDTEDDETSTDETEDETEEEETEEEDEETTKEAAQKWSGFFNALAKM